MRVTIHINGNTVEAELKMSRFLLDADSSGIITEGKVRYVISMEELVDNFVSVQVVKKELKNSYAINPKVCIVD